MKVKDIAAVVEKITPLGLAQSWDNVGLLIGDPEQNVRNVLLTIDMTQAVVAEAKELETDLILSYHPVIWDGLKKIRTDGPSRTVHEIIRSGIVGLLHPHGPGRRRRRRQRRLGRDPRHPGPQAHRRLRPVLARRSTTSSSSSCRSRRWPTVANAVFEAGAGWIGNYRNCGFNTEGTGTFLPLEGAQSGHRPTGQIREGPRGPVRDDRAGGQGPGGRGGHEEGPSLRGAGI